MFSHGGIVSFLIAVILFVPVGIQARMVRVGIYQTNPKIFIDTNGVPKGIFVDVLEDIAKKEGWMLYYVPGTLAETTKRLEKAEIDLMPSANFSEQRSQKFSFNRIPILIDWPMIYTREDREVTNIRELNNKTIGILRGSVYPEILSNLLSSNRLQCRLVGYRDNYSMFKSIDDGKIDAIFSSRFLVHSDDNNHLSTFAVDYSPILSYFAVKKGVNEDLIHNIDRRFSVLINDSSSEYYQSLRYWLNFRYEAVVPKALYGIVIFIAVGVLEILFAVFLLLHTIRNMKQ
jgi:hypothetical protein